LFSSDLGSSFLVGGLRLGISVETLLLASPAFFSSLFLERALIPFANVAPPAPRRASDLPSDKPNFCPSSAALAFNPDFSLKKDKPVLAIADEPDPFKRPFALSPAPLNLPDFFSPSASSSSAVFSFPLEGFTFSFSSGSCVVPVTLKPGLKS
jgi:hypothetical protein